MSRASRDLVSIVIPTTCEGARAQELRRAIESARRQHSVPTRVILIVNGKRFDPKLLARLRADPELCVHYQELGSLPAALRTGRELVETPFFSFVDDDDVLLPGAMAARLRPFENDPNLDAVASNGYRTENGVRERLADDLGWCARDPLAALFKMNWLESCGGLFKTSTVTPDFFDSDVHYREWTWLAFRLGAAGLRIGFVNGCTYEKFDTPGSLSKEEKYLLAGPEIFRRMLCFPLEPPIRRLIAGRLSDSLHSISNHYLDRGDVANARKYHYASLRNLSGLRKYLLYTRKLWYPEIRGR